MTDSPANDRDGTTGPGTRAHVGLDRSAEQQTAPFDPFRAQEPDQLANRTLPDTATPVCTSLDSLGRELTRLRRLVADAAAQLGCSLVASGAAPLGRPDWPP